jgi:hypothetical protein
MSNVETENNDRRESQRTKVDLLINRFLNGHPYMCRMTDISQSGLRIVPILEPQGAPRFMGLQFQLPGANEIITASGEAVAANGATGGGVGVRFTSLPAASASIIAEFLQSS